MFLLLLMTLITLSIIVVFFFSHQDSDLSLWFVDKVGHRVSRLRGQVIWVTGASSGIGASLALELFKGGAKVVISGRDAVKLEDVKQKCLATSSNAGLRQASEDILVLPFELTDNEKHQDMLDKVVSHFNRLDVLVNNAGRTQRAMFHETSSEVDLELFQVNVFATVNLSRTVYKHWMSTNHKGHLVVTSSLTGKVAFQNSATYNATKHALHGYFESLRLEGHPRVKVTINCPGPTYSAAASRAFGGQAGQVINSSEDMKRMKTSRAGHLMAVAIANELDETWICYQPLLCLFYLTQYFPAVSRYLMPRLLTKERVAKLRGTR